MSSNFHLCALFVVVFFRPVHLQGDCACEDPNSGASWGRYEGISGNCEGICDVAVRLATRVCNLNDAINSIQICDVGQPCTLRSTCQGSWGPWGNEGACSASCGGGSQRQTRSCCITRNGVHTNTCRLNSFCLGGGGVSRQERTKPCGLQRRCRTSTTTTATITTAMTTTTTRPTATTGDIEIASTTSNEETTSVRDTTAVEETVRSGPRRPPPPQPAPINVLVLATVLGSVAIVCIAVIIVVIIVLKRKKDKRPSQGNSQTVQPSAPAPSFREERNDYELIAPALPPMRTPSKNLPETPRAVPNALYQPAPDSETTLQVPYSKNELLYLEPIPSPTHRSLENVNVEEATYVAIDEYKK